MKLLYSIDEIDQCKDFPPIFLYLFNSQTQLEQMENRQRVA